MSLVLNHLHCELCWNNQEARLQNSPSRYPQLLAYMQLHEGDRKSVV